MSRNPRYVSPTADFVLLVDLRCGRRPRFHAVVDVVFDDEDYIDEGNEQAETSEGVD